jgi:hypothetical protein
MYRQARFFIYGHKLIHFNLNALDFVSMLCQYFVGVVTCH